LSRRGLALVIDLLFVVFFVQVLGGAPILLWITWVLYSAIAVAWKQCTFGKYLLHLEVVTSRGKPPPLGIAFLRAFGYIVSSLPLTVGFLWALWDPDSETFHDKIAGTRVEVRKGRD
jgi:uncharacterized RDD family membrane protein YckC